MKDIAKFCLLIALLILITVAMNKAAEKLKDYDRRIKALEMKR